MTYQELVTKLCETQRKMMPILEDYDHHHQLPHDLQVAKKDILEWEDVIDGKEGLEHAPEIWPVEKLAHALAEHRDLFDDSMNSHIDEYEALAKQLPAAFANPL